ncbi:MAG: translation initiation factor IF-5A [Candidatus Marsarchaeota archaeon]|jgi:translation initiation factor 5A|nr:translation initiation factor IF-5A [Candidatus Marsarchaeota archaeon]MCL5112689.1 translation initiation factor IF-5A [Candidatus Marsarchaeota archaeon]
MEGEIRHISMKELKRGSYVLIDEEPCRVVEIETSAPGKHGAAKMRVTAINIFTTSKKTLIKPSDASIDAPVINKKKVQVVSITGSNAQLMDMESYEVFELPMDDDMKDKLQPGSEVEIIETMGKRAFYKS